MTVSDDQRQRHGHKDGTAKPRRHRRRGECRRHENGGAVGADPSQPTRGSGGASSAPSAGSGAELQPLVNSVHFISYFMHSEA